MGCDKQTKQWQLAPGELVQLDGARGTRLQVTRGTLWITLERDLRDIVLKAGDAFTIDRGGVTLVEAQGEATVCVGAHHVNERHAGVASPSLASRISAWLGTTILNAERHRRRAPYV
jgi:quercetin dioxygenase-like cupin family protein